MPLLEFQFEEFIASRDDFVDVLVVWKSLVPVDESGDGFIDLGVVGTWNEGVSKE